MAVPLRPELTAVETDVASLTAVLTPVFEQALVECDTEEALAVAVAGQAPKNVSTRSPVFRKSAIVSLSACGVAHSEIAVLLGMTVRSVRTTLYRMRKAGVLVDVEDKLDHAIVPLAMEALQADVSNAASPGHQKAYLAVLQGRGQLRTHTVGKHEGGPAALQVLNVKFEMPSDGSIPVLNGTVVGVPRE